MKINRSALIYSTSLAVILSQQAGTLKVYGGDCDHVVAGGMNSTSGGGFFGFGNTTTIWRTDDSCTTGPDQWGCRSIGTGNPATTIIPPSGVQAVSGSYQITSANGYMHECP